MHTEPALQLLKTLFEGKTSLVCHHQETNPLFKTLNASFDQKEDIIKHATNSFVSRK